MCDLEQRITRIEDSLAIADLRARYCHFLDERRWEEFVDLFTIDGYFEGIDRATGHDEIMRFFSLEVPRIAEKFWHFCTNGTLELNGNGSEACGRISMEYLSVTNGVSYVSAGHYDDVMSKVNGVWKFKSRRISFYFYSPLKDGFTGAVPPRRS